MKSGKKCAYRDLPMHSLSLTESEMELLYGLVCAERKRLREWIRQAQYLEREAPVRECERLDRLFYKLSKYHHGAVDVDE